MYMYICKCICIIYWNKVYKTKQLYTVSISNSVVPFRARCIAVLKYSVYVLVTYKPVFTVLCNLLVVTISPGDTKCFYWTLKKRFDNRPKPI